MSWMARSVALASQAASKVRACKNALPLPDRCVPPVQKPRAIAVVGFGLIAGCGICKWSANRRLSCDSSRSADSSVITFCASTDMKNPYRAFSNHYPHLPPFAYVVPCGALKGTTIHCEHANKALHCTKASVFGDAGNFHEINAEPNSHKCQMLGRKCKDFDQQVWDQYISDVAFQVILQKFQSDEMLRYLLLSTGDAIIAEAATNPVWGIGFSEEDPNSVNPSAWTGQNVQGVALMAVRTALRDGRR